MSQTRPPAVAGLFYRSDPDGLRNEVQAFIAAGAAGAHSTGAGRSGAGAARPDVGTAPKALIVPHAGYPYSGPIAGSAYASLGAEAAAVRRVVLLGPAHHYGFHGIAYSEAEAFATPLGPVLLDRAALAAIADLPQVWPLEVAFDGEHCLEVQLPFLQVLFGDFRLVPLLVGTSNAASIAAVLERLWGGPETLIVISSDLSHYLPYETARALDARTSAAICALRPEAIAADQACGRLPIAGLLRTAAAHGLRGRLLDLRNSGDTAGPRDRVVGYGAYAFG
ncbi:MAG: AmmeMemoRadiSam system protein B [Chromatiaceae bacterium]|nr:MAG: AmmeMemoRadiSam system protein B [Chromatiaceae bacterium]